MLTVHILKLHGLCSILKDAMICDGELKIFFSCRQPCLEFLPFLVIHNKLLVYKYSKTEFVFEPFKPEKWMDVRHETHTSI